MSVGLLITGYAQRNWLRHVILRRRLAKQMLGTDIVVRLRRFLRELQEASDAPQGQHMRGTSDFRIDESH